jgi:cytoskeleton protein RodZ
MAPTVSEPEPIAEEVAVAGDAEVEPIAEDLALAGDAGVEPKQADLNANMDSDDISVDGGERSLDILSLSFSRDCWVEIHDARQQRLVYGLAKAGSSRRVEGEAPFQILVGDSGAVDIRLNGKPTARSRYDAGEGRPARFSLSGEMLETASAP